LAEALVLAIPIFLNSLFSSLPSHQVHHAVKGMSKTALGTLEKMALFSPLVGTSFAVYFQISMSIGVLALSIISGIMLFIVVREYLSNKDLHLTALVTGQAAFLVLLLVLNTL